MTKRVCNHVHKYTYMWCIQWIHICNMHASFDNIRQRESKWIEYGSYECSWSAHVFVIIECTRFCIDWMCWYSLVPRYFKPIAISLNFGCILEYSPWNFAENRGFLEENRNFLGRKKTRFAWSSYNFRLASVGNCFRITTKFTFPRINHGNFRNFTIFFCLLKTQISTVLVFHYKYVALC